MITTFLNFIFVWNRAVPRNVAVGPQCKPLIRPLAVQEINKSLGPGQTVTSTFTLGGSASKPTCSTSTGIKTLTQNTQAASDISVPSSRQRDMAETNRQQTKSPRQSASTTSLMKSSTGTPSEKPPSSTSSSSRKRKRKNVNTCLKMSILLGYNY
ncbi:unnamed protein product [Protopolystoma xenopodis]|uniref:Uncharacterized protein n=1 Tax=Protopolystoma xenopodis TaxID=117903 RepID=A0A448XH81_9PLAT|nr:unnamed protein product [Protopolystoma xenopodis]